MSTIYSDDGTGPPPQGEERRARLPEGGATTSGRLAGAMSEDPAGANYFFVARKAASSLSGSAAGETS